MAPLVIVSVLLFIAVAVVVGRRVGEIACMSVRDGRVLVVRGSVPGGFLNDVADVARRSRVQRGTIRIVRSDSGARVDASGFAPGDVQRVRNILGSYPMSALRSAAPLANPNLGQVIGIAWIAWLLSDRV